MGVWYFYHLRLFRWHHCWCTGAPTTGGAATGAPVPSPPAKGASAPVCNLSSDYRQKCNLLILQSKGAKPPAAEAPAAKAKAKVPKKKWTSRAWWSVFRSRTMAVRMIDQALRECRCTTPTAMYWITWNWSYTTRSPMPMLSINISTQWVLTQSLA